MGQWSIFAFCLQRLCAELDSLKPDGKFSLLNCLAHHKSSSIGEQQKEKFHDLAFRGGPFIPFTT